MTTDDQQGNGREYHPTTREARLAQMDEFIEELLAQVPTFVTHQDLAMYKQQGHALIAAQIAAAVEEIRQSITEAPPEFDAYDNLPEGLESNPFTDRAFAAGVLAAKRQLLAKFNESKANPKEAENE